MTHLDDLVTVGRVRSTSGGVLGSGIAAGIAVLIGSGGIALAAAAVTSFPPVAAAAGAVLGVSLVAGAVVTAVPVFVQVLDQVDAYRFNRDVRNLRVLALEDQDQDQGRGVLDLRPIPVVRRNGEPVPALPVLQDDQGDQDRDALDLLLHFLAGVPALGLGRRAWVPAYLTKGQYAYCCEALESVGFLVDRGARSSGSLVGDAGDLAQALRDGWGTLRGYGDVPALPVGSGLASGLVWPGPVAVDFADQDGDQDTRDINGGAL